MKGETVGKGKQSASQPIALTWWWMDQGLRRLQWVRPEPLLSSPSSPSGIPPEVYVPPSLNVNWQLKRLGIIRKIQCRTRGYSVHVQVHWRTKVREDRALILLRIHYHVIMAILLLAGLFCYPRGFIHSLACQEDIGVTMGSLNVVLGYIELDNVVVS